MSKKIVLIFFLLFFFKAKAQLNFCTGNSGDPIVEETFGEGSRHGSLPKESHTTYRYIKG